jgi:hypothetical protein
MEQPPASTAHELSEYLTRQLQAILNLDSAQLQIITALPTKPAPARIYYFDKIIAPWITQVGAWIYKIVSAGAFVVGQNYTITVSGTTNFVLIGSANNNVGTTFTATGAGAGTGKAFTWSKMG